MALLAAAAGAFLAWRHWHDGTAFDARTSRALGIVVGIEFALAGLGAAALALTIATRGCRSGSRSSSACTCSREHRTGARIDVCHLHVDPAGTVAAGAEDTPE